jgi:ABC-type transport system substrate-binding protein
MFHDMTAKASRDNLAVYDQPCDGLEIIDEHTFAINLERPDPRLLYMLAMPYTAVVSRAAVEYYRDRFAENPVGSGPFRLVEWWREYRIILERNPGFRTEYFPYAANPSDRERRLPLLDRIECLLVKQPLACWLLFLQGELDMNALDNEHFDTVVSERTLELAPALRERGITMYRVPGFQINYVGFNFADPVLAGNPDLRKAISLAYDVGMRLKHFNHRAIPAHGPIPPGVAGHNPAFRNIWSETDLEKAREHLALAGYPGGIDPRTGAPLELAFDQNGNSSQHRQLAELMVDDMRKIGIRINPVLNNSSRFFQKLREGKMQLFRLSWVGDYPDAENFLQLFYGPNAGSCNRAFYRDPEFDRMYERVLSMPDTPERTEWYRKMAEYLTEQCPWIFESYPIDYLLAHDWLQNVVPHDFAFARWKYYNVDSESRARRKRNFRPLSLKDLRHSP